MDKLTEKIRIPVNEKQLNDLRNAAQFGGLRIVDACRFAFHDLTRNPGGVRFISNITKEAAALGRGERVATIQVPITPTMNQQLVTLAGRRDIAVTPVELARIAIVDFADRYSY